MKFEKIDLIYKIHKSLPCLLCGKTNNDTRFIVAVIEKNTIYLCNNCLLSIKDILRNRSSFWS